MSNLDILYGGCHCGAIRLELHSALPVENLTPRACDCSFCQRHAAAYVSDPQGRLHLTVDAEALLEYRQGSQQAHFLLCRTCGVLVAALLHAEQGVFATVNARCLQAWPRFPAAQVASPQQLSAEEKRARWLRLWTPVISPANRGDLS